MILSPTFFEPIGSLPDPVRAVLGGPCICYAKGNPARLSIQDLIDSLVPAVIAARHGCPVCLYFQSAEAVLMASTLHFDPSKADHETMLRWLEDGLCLALEALGVDTPPIYWIDTAAPAFERLVDDLVLGIKAVLAPTDLWGLYAKVPGVTYPCGQPEEAVMVEVYYRNIALYSPSFLTRAFNLAPDRVLFVENTTQRKAIDILHRKAGLARPAMLLYPPAPNTQGKEMCQGNRNHTIELRHTDQQLAHRATQLGHESYYRQVLGQLDVADVMQRWKAHVSVS
ncbi:hypothetical protein [Bordetella ansorpii]|nr:hypothetical protein [Bordetella ansorpii]